MIKEVNKQIVWVERMKEMLLPCTAYETMLKAIKMHLWKMIEREDQGWIKNNLEEAYTKLRVEHLKLMQEISDAKGQRNPYDPYGVYCLWYGTAIITIVVQLNFDGTVSVLKTSVNII